MRADRQINVSDGLRFSLYFERAPVCFNIVRQEFGTAGNWQIPHPHEWVKKVQPFIREDCNLMGRVHTWTLERDGDGGGDVGKKGDREEDKDWIERQMKR